MLVRHWLTTYVIIADLVNLSASEPPRDNLNVRIGYVSDVPDPTMRLKTINEAIQDAQRDGYLANYNFR